MVGVVMLEGHEWYCGRDVYRKWVHWVSMGRIVLGICFISVLVKGLGKGTQSGDEESSTPDCMVELTQLVAAILKGSVSIHLQLIRGVSYLLACRCLYFRTPRFNKMTNA